MESTSINRTQQEFDLPRHAPTKEMQRHGNRILVIRGLDVGGGPSKLGCFRADCSVEAHLDCKLSG